MTNYNDGKWHGWNGGDCPVHPESLIEYVWIGSKGPQVNKAKARCVSSWDSTDTHFISAFRVIKAHREPREFWHSLNGQKGREYCDDDDKAHYTSMGYVHVREVLE